MLYCICLQLVIYVWVFLSLFDIKLLYELHEVIVMLEPDGV